jgi:hypothetical protein
MDKSQRKTAAAESAEDFPAAVPGIRQTGSADAEMSKLTAMVEHAGLGAGSTRFSGSPTEESRVRDAREQMSRLSTSVRRAGL